MAMAVRTQFHWLGRPGFPKNCIWKDWPIKDLASGSNLFRLNQLCSEGAGLKGKGLQVRPRREHRFQGYPVEYYSK